MTPERWQRIRPILDRALELRGEERIAFVLKRCGDDTALRADVEALLRADTLGRPPLDVPVAEYADALVGELADAALRARGQGVDPGLGATSVGLPQSVLAGMRVGPWRIVRELGRGGMAVVYLAERADATYEQQVALKLLKAGSQAEHLVHRFLRERQILASLDDPRIARLVDGGLTDDGQPWFAMEYVEGEHIDRYCDRRGLTVEERLELFVQVARAVHAAHRAHIVHRDLKPANILVTEEGHPRLLDFGIAKPLDSEATPADSTLTLLLLTPQYASPEQVRGEPVTTASDIYQLGLLLYELLTGSRAQRLANGSIDELKRKVASETPPPPSHAVQGNDAAAAARRTTPPSLSRRLRGDLNAIVMMALRKQPSRRYGSAVSLVADLERHSSGRPVQARPERWRYRTGRFLLRHRSTVTMGASAGLAVTLAVLFSTLAAGPIGSNLSRYAFQHHEVRALTSMGAYGRAAMAPDGRTVVYSEPDGERERLRLQRLDTGEDRVVPLPASFRFFGLTLSADGEHAYFLSPRREPEHDTFALFRVPTAGGVPEQLLARLPSSRDIAIERGEKRIAIVRTDARRGDSRLFIADLRTGTERLIATRRATHPYSFPAWSHDGRFIALSVGSADPYDEASSLVVVDVADGSERAPLGERWQYLASKNWLHDDRSIIFLAREAGDPTQLWLFDRRNGLVHQLTNGPFGYAATPSLDARDRSLVTVRADFIGSLWVIPEGRSSKARRLAAATGNPAFLHGGDIVYRAEGALRRIGVDGMPSRRLPTSGRVLGARSSRDGRWIVYSAYQGGGPSHIWLVSADGSEDQQLTHGNGEKFADISPDGRWIVYVSVPEFTLWRVGVDDGRRVNLLGSYAAVPAISPDGRWIACYYKPESDAPWRLVVLPANGSGPVKTLPLTDIRSFSWSPDGEAIDYVDDAEGVSNLWRVTITGGEPEQLTNFQSGRIRNFAWSKDEMRLAVIRGQWYRQVLLLRDLGEARPSISDAILSSRRRGESSHATTDGVLQRSPR